MNIVYNLIVSMQCNGFAYVSEIRFITYRKIKK